MRDDLVSKLLIYIDWNAAKNNLILRKTVSLVTIYLFIKLADHLGLLPFPDLELLAISDLLNLLKSFIFNSFLHAVAKPRVQALKGLYLPFALLAVAHAHFFESNPIDLVGPPVVQKLGLIVISYLGEGLGEALPDSGFKHHFKHLFRSLHAHRLKLE